APQAAASARALALTARPDARRPSTCLLPGDWQHSLNRAPLSHREPREACSAHDGRPGPGVAVTRRASISLPPDLSRLPRPFGRVSTGSNTGSGRVEVGLGQSI